MFIAATVLIIYILIKLVLKKLKFITEHQLKALHGIEYDIHTVCCIMKILNHTQFYRSKVKPVLESFFEQQGNHVAALILLSVLLQIKHYFLDCILCSLADNDDDLLIVFYYMFSEVMHKIRFASFFIHQLDHQ